MLLPAIMSPIILHFSRDSRLAWSTFHPHWMCFIRLNNSALGGAYTKTGTRTRATMESGHVQTYKRHKYRSSLSIDGLHIETRLSHMQLCTRQKRTYQK